eukprot:jgi/Tetstr1/428171/TSEL_018222.t1
MAILRVAAAAAAGTNVGALGAGMSRFRVVLARPAGLANVGSVARLCANFGCAELRIVQPQFDFVAALGAGLEGEMGWYARHQGLALLGDPASGREQCSVAEAVADCSTVVGFSRRRGRRRAPGLTMELGQLYAATRKEQEVALLFGSEADGLTTEELSSATHILEIPTSPTQGSLNLSHAVAISLARVFEDCVASGDWQKGLGGESTIRTPSAEEEPATADDVRVLTKAGGPNSG